MPTHRPPTFSRRSGLFVLVVLALLAANWAAGAASAQTTTNQLVDASALNKPSGKLSARLERLTQPTLRAQRADEQARMLGLPASGAGSLTRANNGTILTYIRVSNSAPATIAALQQAGARIVHVSATYHMVTAYVPTGNLAGIAALANVRNISEVLQPVHSSAGTGTIAAPRASRPAQASCANTIISEGDAQLKANLARQTYNISGTGVTVGVISDSYDKDAGASTHAADDIANDELPGPGNPCGHLTATNVISESTDTNNTDEGRGMLQIVHDLAPNANLAFATANNGLFAFADNVRALRTQAHADVVVDDIGYFNEPFFQDGPTSVAIDEVTSQGAVYATAVGNDNLTDDAGNNITSYEAAAYRPTACPGLRSDGKLITSYAKDCHNFNPAGTSNSSSFVLTPGQGFGMIFQWAEPWFGITTDLDMFLADTNGNVLAVSNDTNSGASGTQVPFEILGYDNESSANQTVRLIIGRASGSGTPRIKTMFTQANRIAVAQFNASNNTTDIFGPSVYGHAGAATALSVAAVPYDDATTPEKYSSQGPQTLYFGAVTSAKAAQPLATAVGRAKPDIAATDGVATSFFGQVVGGTYRFYGTSAAAPHAAAVAALMKERATQQQILFSYGTVQRILAATATPITHGSSQANGAGLINAAAAVKAIVDAPPPVKMYLPLQLQRS